MPAKLVECPRCLGKGYIRAFSNIMGGVCFLCGGAGKIEARTYRSQSPDIDILLAPPADDPDDDRRKLSRIEARKVGMRALHDAAHWFKVALNPKLFYTSSPGPATPEQVAESYGNAGFAVGRAAVDRELFVRALAKARARVPPEQRYKFAWGVWNGVTHADRMYLGVNRNIPAPGDS